MRSGSDENELDRLDPEPVVVKLTTGLAVEVVRLRTRQFFRLLKVLTQLSTPPNPSRGVDGDGPR